MGASGSLGVYGVYSLYRVHLKSKHFQHWSSEGFRPVQGLGLEFPIGGYVGIYGRSKLLFRV